MSNYNSENTHVLATYEQSDGNTRMLLFHVCEGGRHEYVVGSYFNVIESLNEPHERYEWTWGHYFQSPVDAVMYWEQEVAADLLEGFTVNGS